MNHTLIRAELEAALNSIYIRCDSHLQKTLQPEFQLLEKFIKGEQVVLPNNPAGSNDNFKYLNGISVEAKNLVISLVNNGDKNLYHSIMAIINYQMHKNPKLSLNQGKKYYKNKYSYRQYIVTEWNMVDEVFNLCWERYLHR